MNEPNEPEPPPSIELGLEGSDRRLEWTDFSEDVCGRAASVVSRATRSSRAEALEYVSEGMVRLMLYRPVVRSPEALLIKTAINLCKSARARARLIPGPDSSDGHPRERPNSWEASRESVSEDPSIPDVVQERDDIARVIRAVGCLSFRDQELVHKFYFQDNKLTDLDAAEGSRVGTHRDRLERVRRRLRRVLLRGV
jgi:DNA-directed RNA polymerase specialized sigma24 family protein